MANNRSPNPHVVLLPSPGMGHLTPLAELAKRLVLHHNLSATIITFSDHSSGGNQQAFISSLPAGISTTSLPPVPLDDLPPTTHIVTRISVMLARSVPDVRRTLQAIQKTTGKVAAYIVDLFGGDTLSVAKELGIPQFLFCTSNFFYLSFFLHLSTLQESPETAEPLQLPGCIPLQAKDFSRSATDRKSDEFAWMVHHSRCHNQLDGIMVNSFEALEDETARFFREKGEGKPPVLPVGPLITYAGDSVGNNLESCLEWLDQQPDCSVLFISFGSGGSLSQKQTWELAVGLEMSGQRFLWVVRKPTDVSGGGAYFNPQSTSDPLEFLPEGFLERTKEKGMVVPCWAPQAKVLAHEAVGGFLSHCGWNSTLESIVYGVPMIAWPLYSEQPMNAEMLVEKVKVALRPLQTRNDGLVRKEEIAEVVQDLMEGEGGKEVRRRVREIKEAAVKAVSAGGSSYAGLAKMVNLWKSLGNY
ncbi:Hydroquinone glucosyltransferase [Apostasia shenzhenica]|uniref:Glycosyltransferase n=1 Tax=Apostasia shenzhenica TaxID=1088818 RepID=A0A2I0AK64_9ASPA|nr:Hydroquinone glucosyltransferase [Apostasia shenzhenica]